MATASTSTQQQGGASVGVGPGQRAPSLLVRSRAGGDAVRPRVRRDTSRPIRGAYIIGGRGAQPQRARIHRPSQSRKRSANSNFQPECRGKKKAVLLRNILYT